MFLHLFEDQSLFSIQNCDDNGDRILDCTQSQDFDHHAIGCDLIENDQFDFVMLNFPMNSVPVEDFGKGESFTFFQDFNGATGMSILMKLI